MLDDQRPSCRSLGLGTTVDVRDRLGQDFRNDEYSPDPSPPRDAAYDFGESDLFVWRSDGTNAISTTWSDVQTARAQAAPRTGLGPLKVGRPQTVASRNT